MAELLGNICGGLSNTKGNVTVLAIVSIVPIMGAAGSALDCVRTHKVRSFMQAQSDMAALSRAPRDYRQGEVA